MKLLAVSKIERVGKIKGEVDFFEEKERI